MVMRTRFGLRGRSRTPAVEASRSDSSHPDRSRKATNRIAKKGALNENLDGVFSNEGTYHSLKGESAEAAPFRVRVGGFDRIPPVLATIQPSAVMIAPGFSRIWTAISETSLCGRCASHVSN